MEGFLSIDGFTGINEYHAEGLVDIKEATKAFNCNTDSGALRTVPVALDKLSYGDIKINSLSAYYGDNGYSTIIVCGDGVVRNDKNEYLYRVNSSVVDTVNFEYKGKKIMVGTTNSDNAFMIGGHGNRGLKNRRISYNDKGEVDGYIDANGNKVSTEEQIQTLAPIGSFVELHYDRLWIAGEPKNPDRVYFSTANINGADIEDFTIPIEEAEANQHGGFLDIRSYDGSKIIGMKVVFNSIVIFKNKSAYKIFGNSPDNYELVQLFSSNGAIADKSICIGSNGAFFLNSDGIYFYDGTNTNLISQKIQETIKTMNKSYASKSVGIYYKNKYFLSIPTGNSSTNNLLIEYDVDNKTFLLHKEVGITGMIEYNDELLVSSDGMVKALFKGNTNLPLYWETPNYDYEKKNARKNSNYIYFRGRGNGKVKFKVITERKTKEVEVTLQREEKLYKTKLKNKGRIFKLVIENVNGCDMEITSPQLLTEIDAD